MNKHTGFVAGTMFGVLTGMITCRLIYSSNPIQGVIFLAAFIIILLIGTAIHQDWSHICNWLLPRVTYCKYGSEEACTHNHWHPEISPVDGNFVKCCNCCCVVYIEAGAKWETFKARVWTAILGSTLKSL